MISTFAQNMVRGGSPPILLTTRVPDQNGIPVFMDFNVIVIILFKVTHKVIE